MLRFGVKLGLVGGTCYLVSEQGVWKDSNKSIELCNKICKTVSPYTQEITKQIPYKLPSLPRTNQISYLSTYYWNSGVKATFAFLANIPCYIEEYTSKGIYAIMDNSEIKNMLNPVQPAVTTKET